MTTDIKHGHFRIGTAEVPFEEQERDLEIGKWLYRLRMADADQLCRLIEGKSADEYPRTGKRLTRMKRLEILVLPEGQKAVRGGKLSRHLVYSNSSKMGRRLQKEGLVRSGRLDWTQRNRQAGREFVEHTVQTSELLVTFVTSARQYSNLETRFADELLLELPERTQTIERPWFFEGIPQGFTVKGKQRVYPDAVLSVRQAKTGKGNEQFFVAEIDTSSMTVVAGEKLERELKAALLDLSEATSKTEKTKAKLAVDQARYKLLRHNLTTESPNFLRKLIVYYSAFRNKWHKEHFGWPSFRVLIKTRNESHLERLREALQYVTGGQAADLFLFSTFDEIRACDDIFHHKWVNGAGEPVTLA